MDKMAFKAIYWPKGEALEYADLGLNLYSGCSHGCKFCYNKSRFNGSCADRMKKSSLENIEHDLNLIGKYDDKTPVQISFVGDPYDLGRPDNSYTRQTLEVFKKYNHPFQVLTKGGTRAAKDFDLYFEGCRFGVTLTFDSDQDSLIWEPGAALPGDRIEALRIAHEHGLKTWVSLEPVIKPAQTLQLIELSAPYTDFYGVGKWNHDQRAKAIDWHKFRSDAEELLAKYGKSYKVKAALLMAS